MMTEYVSKYIGLAKKFIWVFEPWQENPNTLFGQPNINEYIYFRGTFNRLKWFHTSVTVAVLDVQFTSVQSLSRVWLFVTPCHSLCDPTLCEPQHARPPCPSPTPGVHQNSCPLNRCHPTISSFVIPFSSCPQSFPASGSFPMSQLFASGGQSIGVSASTSVLPMNTQDWSPLGWTGWISLQSKGLSRIFSKTTVQKHQFFGTQLSL